MYTFGANCRKCSKKVTRKERDDGYPDMYETKIMNETFYFCKECYEDTKEKMLETLQLEGRK